MLSSKYFHSPRSGAIPSSFEGKSKAQSAKEEKMGVSLGINEMIEIEKAIMLIINTIFLKDGVLRLKDNRPGGLSLQIRRIYFNTTRIDKGTLRMEITCETGESETEKNALKAIGALTIPEGIEQDQLIEYLGLRINNLFLATRFSSSSTHIQADFNNKPISFLSIFWQPPHS